jgi:hypothetical protein
MSCYEVHHTTVFKNFGLQPPKVRAVRLTVVGPEQVMVPAGTFDAFTVALTSPDDDNKATYWVATD